MGSRVWGVGVFRPLMVVATLMLSATAPATESGAAGGRPPAADLAALWREHAAEVRVEGGRLAGPGGERLSQAIAAAQIVSVGEEHDNADIPPLVAVILAQMRAAPGPVYFATEQDPVTMRRFSAPPLRGDFAAQAEFVRRWPQSVTFGSDADLALLAAASTGHTGKGPALWGCEQVFGVRHVLEPLREAVQGAADRAVLAALIDTITPHESDRDFANRPISDPTLDAAFATMASLFAKSSDPEVRFAIDGLLESRRIYGAYRNGEAKQVPGYFSSNTWRERAMKSLCRDAYRAAARLDGRPPRVLMKFGFWHLFDGFPPTGLAPSLGSFMRSLAFADGGETVSIAVLAAQDSGKPRFAAEKEFAFLAPFAEVMARPGWWMVDLRPLREYPHFRLLRAGFPDQSAERTELHRLVYGYDVLLFIGPFNKAAKTILPDVPAK